MDINFGVTDPSGKPMVTEPRSMDGLHGLDIKQTGEYEICLDNTFSRMTGKYTEVITFGRMTGK